jgi:teichuronic acid biosynthesis glycosyltransferase TuaG
MSDLVSVIIPAHNAVPFLERTLRSVLAQTHRRLEILVVNDGSTDGTLSVAREIATADSRLRVIDLRANGGPAQARNAAIEACTGRFIAFLDSDDLWMPDKLARQLSAMRSTNAVLSYTACRTIDEQDRNGAVIGVPASVTYAQLLQTNVIVCSSAVYDVAKFGKVSMPNIAKRQDYGLWLNILKGLDNQRSAVVGIDEPLVLYRLRSQSVSSNKLSAARYQWRVYRDLERLPLWQSAYYFVHYAFNGLVKHQRRSS